MKKIICILPIFLLLSCSKDDVDDASLEGNWTLTNVLCYCGFGEDYDFSSSTIEFDTSRNKVMIQNNGEFQFIRETGTYGYSGKGSTIKFDNGDSFLFEIDGSELRLIFEDEPNIADDEVTFYYRRN